MKHFLSVAAGFATIAGLCVATFQLGKSQAAQSVESIRINIDNTIDGVIANVARENREGVAGLLQPVAALIDSNLGADSVNREEIQGAAEDLQKNITRLSLLSYQAEVSPFVPPMNKAQFLCHEVFTLAYSGQSNQDRLEAYLKINSRRESMRPGDIRSIRSDDKTLQLTYLEYRKEMNGPVLKYECKDR